MKLAWQSLGLSLGQQNPKVLKFERYVLIKDLEVKLEKQVSHFGLPVKEASIFRVLPVSIELFT